MIITGAGWLRGLRLWRSARGVTMVEVLIAIVALALIVVSISPVLILITKARFGWHEQRVAESLTRTIVEYVKRSDYDASLAAGHPLYDSDNMDYGALLGLDGDPYYGDYEVDVQIDPLDPEADGTGDDDGIQKITVTVTYRGRTALTTDAYKVNR